MLMNRKVKGILWFYLIVPQALKAVFGENIGDIRLTSALVAFALFEAAYYSEIIRAGIQSVAKGQMAAGLALGLTPAQTMRMIILPQAFRNMLPLLPKGRDHRANARPLTRRNESCASPPRHG